MDKKKIIITQIITFLSIVTILTTGIYIWMFLGAKDSMAAVILMMYTPGISAVLTSVVLKDKISDYGWNSGKIKYLAYAYILPLVISLIVYGTAWLAGITDFTADKVMNYKWVKMLGFELPVPFTIGMLSKMSIGFLFTCIFVFGEEAGWSGFLTRKLSKIFPLSATSLIIGIFWSAWHFPAIIGGFYGQGTPIWVSLPCFTLVLTGNSFIRTALVAKSKSLWTGVFLHSSSNIILMGMFWEMTVQNGMAAYFVSETGVITGVVCLLTALIFFRTQTRKAQ